MTTLGAEFLTGQSATCNTSIAGQNVTLAWQQSQQNFVITGASGGGGGGETCKTKVVPVQFFSDQSTWTIANPCTGNTLNIDVATTNSGFFACAGDIAIVQSGTQYSIPDFRWRDSVTNSDVCNDLVAGIVKHTVLTVDPGVPLDFKQPFSMFYEQKKIVDFP